MGFDSNYVVRTGDLGSDGDTDVYLSPLSTGTGNVGEFILENDSGAFTLDTNPTLTELGAAQSWSVSTQLKVDLEDVNVDGVWDAAVTGIEGSIDDAVDQIVISGGTKGAAPTGLIAVDADLKNFFGSVKPWYNNLSYYDTTVAVGSWILHNATSAEDNYNSYWLDCLAKWGYCQYRDGTLSALYGSETACIRAIVAIQALTSHDFTLEVDGERHPQPLSVVCNISWRAYFGRVITELSGKNFSLVPMDAIEQVADFVKIWEAGQNGFEVEDLADVLEDVLGITIGGFDFSGIDRDDLDAPNEQRVFEVEQGLFAIWRLFGQGVGNQAEDPDFDRDSDTVYVTRRRVRFGGINWSLRDSWWHTALEYTYPTADLVANFHNPTIAAYNESGLLVSRRNDPSERGNEVVASVTSTRHATPVALWGALVRADKNYRNCLPFVDYDFPIDGDDDDAHNSNGYVAGILNFVGAAPIAALGTYTLGNDLVPDSEFRGCATRNNPARNASTSSYGD